MKTMILVFIALLITGMLIVYQLSTAGALSAYQGFADRLCGMKFEDAKKKVFRSAEGDFDRAEAFCRKAYADLEKASYRPRYAVLLKERRAFSTVRLKLEQTVPMKVPGRLSAVETADVVFVHQAEMLLRFGFWKVARFNITKKVTGDEEKVPHPDFAKAVRDGYTRTGRKTSPVAGNVVPSILDLSSPPARAIRTDSPAVAFRTFKLKNGSTVQGKVVEDNLLYYNVEDARGHQTLVMKEDIAG